MFKVSTTALAGVFGAAATFGMLLGGAQVPVQAGVLPLSALQAGVNAHTLIADNDDNENDDNQGGNRDRGDREDRGNHGHKNCQNPAGNTRGWCKHQNNQGQNGSNRNRATVSGTVLGVSGNSVNFRLDNGQVINVLDNNGTQLNVGQHYRLRGVYQNGQFVLGGNGAYNNGGYNNGGYNNGGNQQTLSGNIISIGNGTITLLNNPSLVINVQQAINNNATNGALTIGRHVTVYGYAQGNVFYATSIQ